MDSPDWKFLDQLMRECKATTDELDTIINDLEADWNSEEEEKPSSERYQDDFIEKRQVLQDADCLVRRMRELCFDEKCWREIWMPECPYAVQRAYHCVYAHALGLHENEHVAPMWSVVQLDIKLRNMLEMILEM